MLLPFRSHDFYENPHVKEFSRDNMAYNNKAASFLAVIYMLVTSVSITVAYISYLNGAQNTDEVAIILPTYIAGFIFSTAAIIILTVLRKKGHVHSLASELTAILQTAFSIVLFQVAAHIEIPAIGIKNINAIILMMFCIVFFVRFKLSVTFALEIATTTVTVILLLYEKDTITNFYPSLVNIIVAGFLSCICAYLYWRSRIESYLSSSELKKLAVSDALTKISNRRGFDAFLESSWNNALADGSQISLFVIDIDHFKIYNDTYGHVKGDECLSLVAGILAKSIRKDDFVARYGGEEFAVILTNTNIKAAKIIAERIFANISNCCIPHENCPVTPFVTVSIGCMSCYPSAFDGDSQDFIKKADQALYTAKESGRNRLVLHPEADDEA